MGDGGGLPQEEFELETGVDFGFLPGGVGVVGVGVVGGGLLLVVVSSSTVRFLRLLFGSGRGGTNGVGDDGAVEGPEPLAAPLRPLIPPFLNLLCTEDRVSVKLLRSVLGDAPAARPRLPRPFGVRESRSLVGESQNLQN